VTSYIKKYSPELLGSLICLTLGMLSGYGVKAGASNWYINLHKPGFNPPSWIFGPVWTVLYLMMGMVLGKVWKERTEKPFLLQLFIIQLLLNLLWSPLFFYLHRIGLALLDICLLWACLILFMILVKNQRASFLLFLPYTLWVSFAVILNFNIYKMNLFHAG
jgi:benzodiazapine receptor